MSWLLNAKLGVELCIWCSSINLFTSLGILVFTCFKWSSQSRDLIKRIVAVLSWKYKDLGQIRLHAYMLIRHISLVFHSTWNICPMCRLYFVKRVAKSCEKSCESSSSSPCEYPTVESVHVRVVSWLAMPRRGCCCLDRLCQPLVPPRFPGIKHILLFAEPGGMSWTGTQCDFGGCLIPGVFDPNISLSITCRHVNAPIAWIKRPARWSMACRCAGQACLSVCSAAISFLGRFTSGDHRRSAFCCYVDRFSVENFAIARIGLYILRSEHALHTWLTVPTSHTWRACF